MLRASKLIPASLVAVFSLFIVALPGAALTNSTASKVSDGPFEMADVATICDGDCRFNPFLEERRLAAPFDTQFEVGLKVLSDGLDLSIVTEGNIYILGPLAALDTVHLSATSVFIEAGGFGDLSPPGTLVIDSGLELTPTDVGLFLPPRVRVLPPLVCACVFVGDLSGTLTRNDVEGAVLTALVGLEPLDPPSVPPPGVTIQRAGDIYIDVSRVEFFRFEATAGQSLVIVGLGAVPVPEPGTALLLGLGLSSLALRRTRTAA